MLWRVATGRIKRARYDRLVLLAGATTDDIYKDFEYGPNHNTTWTNMAKRSPLSRHRWICFATNLTYKSSFMTTGCGPNGPLCLGVDG